jgi:predicted amidohydrolase
MPRQIKVAAAQMGPNNEGVSREEIVERMLGLLERAAKDQVELIAYPEMALTTYFPKRIRADFDQFFETVNLDQMTPVRRRWNFLGRRQPQHYGILLQPVTERESHR